MTLDAMLIAEIEKRLRGFHSKVFGAALKSFEQSDNPLRFNNCATNLRELSRLILRDLSPEQEIKECCWFEQAFNEDGKPVITRAQRVKYSVQAGLPDDFVRDQLKIDVPPVIKRHGDLMGQLSKFTHVGETTFGVDEIEADDRADRALEVFADLLQTIDECKDSVHATLEEVARRALSEEMISQTVEALDTIATHYTIRYTLIEEFNLTHMGAQSIEFHASGSVACQLQYGSDSDYHRRDGLRTNDSYPLTCEFEADIDNPLDLRIKNLEVDNSSFYE